MANDLSVCRAANSDVTTPSVRAACAAKTNVAAGAAAPASSVKKRAPQGGTASGGPPQTTDAAAPAVRPLLFSLWSCGVLYMCCVSNCSEQQQPSLFAGRIPRVACIRIRSRCAYATLH